MFFKQTSNRNQGKVSFESEKCLVDKQFKYRSLGEMVALARATGQRPLPTRNGVYTGEAVIPREVIDRVNMQRSLMDSYDEAEAKLKEAQSQLESEAKERELANIKAQAIAEHEASRNGN